MSAYIRTVWTIKMCLTNPPIISMGFPLCGSAPFHKNNTTRSPFFNLKRLVASEAFRCRSTLNRQSILLMSPRQPELRPQIHRSLLLGVGNFVPWQKQMTFNHRTAPWRNPSTPSFQCPPLLRSLLPCLVNLLIDSSRGSSGALAAVK